MSLYKRLAAEISDLHEKGVPDLQSSVSDLSGKDVLLLFNTWKSFKEKVDGMQEEIIKIYNKSLITDEDKVSSTWVISRCLLGCVALIAFPPSFTSYLLLAICVHPFLPLTSLYTPLLHHYHFILFVSLSVQAVYGEKMREKIKVTYLEYQRVLESLENIRLILSPLVSISHTIAYYY